MRRLIVSNLVSLDGFIAGPGGDLSAMPFDANFSRHNLELVKGADALLFGRKTYLGMVGYWPGALASENPVERGIAERNRELRKIVVSDSLDEGIDPWTDTTEVVDRGRAHARIAELKEADGGDIVTFGSATLVRDLLDNGLVDELHLMVGPDAVGDGISIFGGPLPLRPDLLGVEQLPDSPNVLLRYAFSSLPRAVG